MAEKKKPMFEDHFDYGGETPDGGFWDGVSPERISRSKKRKGQEPAKNEEQHQGPIELDLKSD